MKILITGATGFLGSCLAKNFLIDSHDVTVLIRPNADMSRLSTIKSNLTVVQSQNIMEAFLLKGKFDLVIHSATCYGRDDDILSVIDANLVYPFKILKLMKDNGGGVFFNTDTFFAKDYLKHNYLPSYTLTKKLFRNMGSDYAKRNQIKFFNLVLEHIYGPGDSSDKFISMILRDMKKGVSEVNLSSGRQMRDFIYIDDAILAYTVLARNVDAFAEYTNLGVGTGKSLPVKEFVEKAKMIAKSNIALNFGAIPDRKEEIQDSFADNSILRSLGWVPQFDIDTGLARVIEYDYSAGK